MVLCYLEYIRVSNRLRAWAALVCYLECMHVGYEALCGAARGAGRRVGPRCCVFGIYACLNQAACFRRAAGALVLFGIYAGCEQAVEAR